jgi:hypothetical protein
MALPVGDRGGGMSVAVSSTDVTARRDPDIAAPGMSNEMRRSILDLERRYNWNSRRARAVRKATCEAALDFVALACAHRLPEPIAVGASPRGKVFLEWRNERGLAMAEVSRDPSNVYYQLATTDGYIEQEELPAGEVIERIRTLYSLK